MVTQKLNFPSWSLSHSAELTKPEVDLAAHWVYSADIERQSGDVSNVKSPWNKSYL